MPFENGKNQHGFGQNECIPIVLRQAQKKTHSHKFDSNEFYICIFGCCLRWLKSNAIPRIYRTFGNKYTKHILHSVTDSISSIIVYNTEKNIRKYTILTNVKLYDASHGKKSSYLHYPCTLISLFHLFSNIPVYQHVHGDRTVEYIVWNDFEHFDAIILLF